jgi:signal transduction histidine kinase
MNAKQETSAVAVIEPPPRLARAHAMKNCLAVVNAVNLIIAKEVSAIGRERLARSQDAVQRMLALVKEDLRPFSPSQNTCTAAQQDAEQILRDVVARVADRAEAGQVTLVVTCAAAKVCCDRSALTEALGNIVLNAIEATAAGGTVFLVARANPDGSHTWLVRDNGAGMSDERIANVGTPFQSGKPGGSGIGLTVTRATIARHGGMLRVTSRPDEGTVVSVWLPPLG